VAQTLEAVAPVQPLFAGVGEARAAGRALDWAASALGPPEGWPQSLKTCVQLCLDSRAPTFVVWGAERSTIYNDAALELIRPQHPRAFGAPLERLSSEIRTLLGSCVERVFASGVPGQLPDESSFACSALRDETGLVVGAFASVLEAVLPDPGPRERSLRSQLEQAERTHDEFLDALSHDLRTPLAAILIWGGMIASKRVVAGELERAAHAIVQSAQSLSLLIDDLQDFSRLATGRASLKRESADVAAIARAALDDVRASAASRDISLALELPDALGAAMLDARRIQQALRYLLASAIKLASSGARIVLRARRQLHQLSLDISDGPAQSLAWQRASSEAQIELAMCRRLIELHGGQLSWTHAGHGVGSSPRVVLPWVEPESAARPASLPTLAAVSAWIVADDPEMREQLRSILTQSGAQVVALRSADEVLEQLEQRPPGDADGPRAVLLCDLALKGTSAFELMARLRAHPRRPPPACAISGDISEPDRRRTIEAGFEFHLATPITPENLIGAVQDLWAIAADGGDGRD
jgi:signal transduction histidine kinase/CheY-like chemotaxis protein